MWSILLPTVAALVAAGVWVWRPTRVADLLAAGSPASVYFSRAFTTTYWWLPVAWPRPRPWEVAGGVAGPVVVAAAVPERTARQARSVGPPLPTRAMRLCRPTPVPA